MRAFICLTSQSDDGAVEAIAICARDRAAALADAIAMLNKQTRLVGILTQEEVTGMGMLLAANRAGMRAYSCVEM